MTDGKNVKIQVGHVERFNPALVALEKFELKPMFIESHRLRSLIRGELMFR